MDVSKLWPLIMIALYLGVGIGLCMMLRMENKPGHWTNYLGLILGWPVVFLLVGRRLTKGR